MLFYAESLLDLPAVGRKIINELADYKILLVNAKMGAGKTTLIAELCRQLGIKDEASSPTYSIVNEYITANNQQIYHFDLYRLKSLEEVIDIGFEDYLYSGNLCIIEWPEIAESLIREPAIELTITVTNERRIYELNAK